MTPKAAEAGFGVVEGFYGKPWSHDARLRVVDDLGAAGLSTYFWAPKDDPRHRSSWMKALDRAALDEIAELAGRARAVGVEVVHGISPSGAVRRERLLRASYGAVGNAVAALVSRVRDVKAAGVTSFGLLFDDTWPTLIPDAATFNLGEAHGRLAVAVADEARCAPGRVLFVPAVYHRRARDLSTGGLAYLRGIASVVGRDVPVAWTGPSLFSSWISGTDVEELEQATGLRVFLWNNAIANDWLPLVTGALGARRRVERLSAGPIMNLSVDVLARSGGVLLNGAREPELTRVALRALGDLIRDRERFDPVRSWATGIDAVFGDAAPFVRELLDRVRGHPLCAPHARDWTLRELADAAGRGDEAARRALAVEAERLASLESRLAAALADHPAWAELSPTARSVRQSALRMLALLAGNPEPAAGPIPAWETDLEGSLTLLRKPPPGTRKRGRRRAG